jgi:Cupredoxin-like domain
MKSWGWCAIIVIVASLGCAPKSENQGSANEGTSETPTPALSDSSPGLRAPGGEPLVGDTSAHATAPHGGGGGSNAMPNTGPKTRVGPRVIEIAITDQGFDPPEPKVRRGEAVTLAFTRKTERTCAVDAIFPRLGKHVDLPMNETVRVDIPAGVVTDTLYFACGMNMISGMVRAR